MASVQVQPTHVAASPLDTFTVETVWTVPQQMYADWSYEGQIDHVESQLNGRSISVREVTFEPGTWHMTHTFRVNEDARPGATQVTFNLYDPSAQTTHSATVEVEVAGEKIQPEITRPPPETVLPNQQFEVGTRWSIPRWIQDPSFVVSEPGELTYVMGCIEATCYRGTSSNPNTLSNGETGTVHVDLTQRAGDRRQFWTNRFEEKIFLDLRDGGHHQWTLEIPVTIATEARIELGGDARRCGTDYCVVFGRVIPGGTEQRTVDIYNRGSEDLTYQVSPAGGWFAQSASPAGWLPSTASPVDPSFYLNTTSFPVVFTAPEADVAEAECDSDPTGRFNVCETTVPITSNDPSNHTLLLHLKGNVDPPERLAVDGDVDGDEIDFGVVTVGTTGTKHIRIFNAGGQFLSGYLPSQQPGGDGGFSFTADHQAFYLDSGESLEVTLTAQPSKPGAHEAKLRIAATEQNEPVERLLTLKVITGPEMEVIDVGSTADLGPSNAVVASGGKIEFGPVSATAHAHPSPEDPGVTAIASPARREIVIRNVSKPDVALNVSWELNNNTPDPEWRIASASRDLPSGDRLRLAPGESVKLVIELTPDGDGRKSAILSIFSDASNYPGLTAIDIDADVLWPAGVAEVTLPPPALDASERFIDLGYIGRRQSKTVTVNVRNVGEPESRLKVDAVLHLAVCDPNAPPGSNAPAPSPSPGSSSRNPMSELQPSEPTRLLPCLTAGEGDPASVTTSVRTLSATALPLQLKAEQGDIILADIMPTTFGILSGTLEISTNDPNQATITYTIRAESAPYSVPDLVNTDQIADPIWLMWAITRSYHEFDVAMRAYMGQPVLSNWLTYNKHWARHRTAELIHLRAFQRLLALNEDVVSPQYTAELVRIAASHPPTTADEIAARDTLRGRLASGDPRISAIMNLTSTVLEDAGLLGTAVRNLLARDAAIPRALPISATTETRAAAAVALSWHWHSVFLDVERLRDKVVAAEVAAYQATAGSYHRFLMEANRESNPMPTGLAGDVNGLMSAALAMYATAKQAGDDAAAASPEDAEPLLEQRRLATVRGSELFALVHQAILQAQLFDFSPEFADTPPFLFIDPTGERPYAANWSIYGTRLGLDPSQNTGGPSTITPANAPSLTIPGDDQTGWTLADYMPRNLGPGAIMESPERVPLPGPALPNWESGDLGSVEHRLGMFNELVHIFAVIPAVEHLLGSHTNHDPSAVSTDPDAVPADREVSELIHNPGAATTGAEVSEIVAGICAGISLAAGSNPDVQEMAELCSLTASGTAAGLMAIAPSFEAPPLAIIGAGILFMRGMINLAEGLYDMQLYLSCWPNCQDQPTLASWAYH
jgi:hypothetical protein